MPSPILARADALMHRRRQGESGPLDDVPVLTDTVETSHEIPVLQASKDLAQGQGESAIPDKSPDHVQLAEEVAARINARLQTILPALINEVVQEIMASAGTMTQHE